MDLVAHLRQTLDYNAWANRQTAHRLATDGPPPEKALRIFCHIIGAEQLWLARIHHGRAPQMWPQVWPTIPPENFDAAIDDLAGRWSALLDGTTVDDLARSNDYVNSKGEPWSSTVGEIITHVTHHSSYHRGQIATLLGAAGRQPVLTDYIHAIRQGLLKS